MTKLKQSLFSLVFLLGFSVCHAADEKVENDTAIALEVNDPYIEMHTGPGRGYPVFYVVSRGEKITIQFRKTDWFSIRTQNGKQGWIHRDEMVLTLNPSGTRVEIKDAGPEEFITRNWEYGVLGGDFEGASVITAYAAYHFTTNLSTEISLSHVLGNISSSTLLGVGLVHQPFPEWRVSPFFVLGTGIKDTTAKATLVQAADRSDTFANVGVGARMHFTKRFLMRFDYRTYVVFSSRDDNEEIDEWKLGFGFFF